jgi:hypothetical protein
VTDGTSNTAAFSEYAGGRLFYVAPRGAASSQNQLESMCTAPFLPPLDSSNPNVADRFGFYGGGFYMHVKKPNHPECKMEVEPIPHIYGVSAGADEYRLVPPSSYHVGLVHMTFLDGSVRSISDNVDAAVFRACGTIRGGEVINEF